MAEIKFDLKDKRILSELNSNANISASKLAKKVRISRQVAEYRINKLFSQKTIYAFYTLVDAGRLGYSSFRIHLRLKNVNEERYSNFAKELFDNYSTFWVGFISGSFDFIIDIFAKNSNEFDRILSDIIQKNKDIIQSYDTMVILEMDLYDYGYFLDDKKIREKVVMHRNLEKVKIDDLDKRILKNIKYNSRAFYEDIGKKVGLTRNAVKNRIKKLEEKKVIVGYKTFINFNHFSKQSFKIFIKYNNSKIEEEKELLDYLKSKKGVLATLKFLGKWNLDIEIHTKDVKELQQFIINLRNKYEIIGDYEIAQLIDDYGIDFYPDKLL